MIDVNFSDNDTDLDPVAVVSPTGLLIGIFWGSRFEICEAIDEITDPNECKYRRCEPGGIRLGCFHGEEEVSVETYSKVSDAALDESEVRFEGLSESLANSLDAADLDWLPIVPPGYMYFAGVGLTKIDSEWN